MRLRNSVSSSSGTFTLNGRIAVLSEACCAAPVWVIVCPPSRWSHHKDLREKYFTKEPDGSWKISDDIRNRVSFGRLNIYDEGRVALLGALDVVFCRNVIIYFDDASKRVVINNFYNRLVDGGYLLLGHSESLISLSTQFKLKHLKNDMVYQK